MEEFQQSGIKEEELKESIKAEFERRRKIIIDSAKEKLRKLRDQP